MRTQNQQRIWHICHGEQLGHMLRHAFGVRVVAIMDDCSVGPLVDIDSPFQTQRVGFWCAQVSQKEADRRHGRQWEDLIAADRRELAQLDPMASEFIIWSADDAAEQCLLRRAAWWLSGHEAAVSLTTFDVADFDPDGQAPRSLSAATRHHLLARFLRRRFLISTDRDALAAQWRRLREDRSMLRVWGDGHLKIGQGQKLLLPDTQSLAAVLPVT